MKKTILNRLLLLSLTGAGVLASCGNSNGSSKYDVWTSYSTAKVIRQATRNQDFVNTGEILDIKMMREEYESTQLIITSEGRQSFDFIKTELVDEKTGKTIPVENIEVYVQKYMDLIVNTHSSDNHYFTGGDAIPDMLLPIEYAKKAGENYVEKNTNQGITVEVSSYGVEAGTYKGNFTLKVGNDTKLIPIEVTVWDFALEGKSAMQSCWLIYSMYMFTGEYDASEHMVDTYMDFLSKYKAIPYVIQESVMNSPEALMQDVERLWDMKNFNSIIIPYDFPLTYEPNSYQGDEAAEYIVKLAEKSTEENFYLDYALFYPSTYDEADVIATKKAASPTFFQKGGRYEQTLELAIKKLENKGYFIGKSEEWTNRVKSAIRNIPDVFTNCNYVESWVEDWPATFCPQIHVLDDQKVQEIYQDYAEVNSNNDFWTYTCCSPNYPYPSNHLDDDNLSMRIMGWMEKSLNVNGYLFFMANMYTTENKNYEYTTPYIVADRNGAANGDGYIMYPGRPYGSPTPFPSNRLVTYRDGLEDYEMIEVYENKIKEACKFYGLNDIKAKDYVSDLYSSLFTNSIATEDHHKLYQAREELANRILSFENKDNMFTNVKYEDGKINLHVYSTNPTMKFDGSDADEVKNLGDGKFEYILALGETKKDIQIKTDDNTIYTYSNPGYKNVTNFASNGVKIVTDEYSSYTIDTNGSIKFEINSHKFDRVTETLSHAPKASIKGVDLQGAKKVIFNYSNTADKQQLSFDVDFNFGSKVSTVGGHFSLPGKTKTLELDLTKSKHDLSKLKSIDLAFANYYFDQKDELQIYDTREFVIEDIFVMY